MLEDTWKLVNNPVARKIAIDEVYEDAIGQRVGTPETDGSDNFEDKTSENGKNDSTLVGCCCTKCKAVWQSKSFSELCNTCTQSSTGKVKEVPTGTRSRRLKGSDSTSGKKDITTFFLGDGLFKIGQTHINDPKRCGFIICTIFLKIIYTNIYVANLCLGTCNLLHIYYI